MAGNTLWFKKGNNTSLYIYMCIIMFVLVSFVSLHCGKLMEGGAGAMDAFLGSLTSISRNPLGCFPITMMGIKAWGVGVAVYLFLLLYVYVELEKNKRDAIGEEDGSAGFMTDKKIKEFTELYVSPHLNKKKMKIKDRIKKIFVRKKGDSKNIILTNKMMLSLNCSITQRNLNVLVIGGSGSGKSRFYVKPNLLQANTSFVVTDPAGELLETMGVFLEEQGYRIQVFNLIKMQHSCCYNPFAYIRDTEGVPMLVNCLIKNTTPPNSSSSDPFWEKSETALLCSLISYLIETFPGRLDKCNFTEVMKLLRDAEIDENNANMKSNLDRKMDNLKAKNPSSMAVKDYTTFKMGAGKTLKSILISCAVRLHAFDLPGVASLVRTDMENDANNLHLDRMGDEKNALFVIIPAADDTYNFIVSMMYYQLFESLYYKAENIMPRAQVVLSKEGEKLTVCESKREAEELLESYKKAKIKEKKKRIKKLNEEDEYEEVTQTFYQIVSKDEFDQPIVLYESPYEQTAKNILSKYKSAKSERGVKCLGSSGKTLANHVHFLLDEFANVGQIPDFDKKLATMRKYEISCSIILQNKAQLDKLYDKDAQGLIGNCDEILFLGSSEFETCKYFSDKLGDATITTRSASRSLGSSKKGGGGNYSFQHKARKLLTPDEVSMVQKECLLFIRGFKPVYSKKYDYPKHPNYKYTGDSDHTRIFYCSERFNNKINIEEPAPIEEKGKVMSQFYKEHPEEAQKEAEKILEDINKSKDGETVEKIKSIEKLKIDSDSMAELRDLFDVGRTITNKFNKANSEARREDKKEKPTINKENNEDNKKENTRHPAPDRNGENKTNVQNAQNTKPRRGAAIITSA